MSKKSRQFSASALIHASPKDVYGIVADYRYKHPQILPMPPFVSLSVEQGGTGAGTVIVVQMRLLGKLQSFRATISEPEPGRVLVETTDTGYVTTFTVEPRADGTQAFTTIATEIVGRQGILGALECWFVKRLLVPVYLQELTKLAAVARVSA